MKKMTLPMIQDTGASRALGPDEPVMKAWAKYQASAEYANTIRWAGEAQKGSLWAVFLQGWAMAGGERP